MVNSECCSQRSAAAAEDDAVLLGGCFQRLELAAGAQIGERRAVALGGIAGGIEGEMQDAARRLRSA